MKLLVPSSLNEISLIQYQEYVQEIEARKKLPDSEEYLKIKKIEIFCKISREQIMQLEYDSVENISDVLDNLLEKQPEMVERFTVDNIKFGWLPDLDKMAYGELMDLNSNISDWSAMHIAMGVLYRPIKKELKNGLYNVENYESDKYHQQIRKMPLSAVISAMVFFWTLGLDLLKYTHKYLEMEVEEKNNNKMNSSLTGTGIVQLMNSLEEILPNTKLLNK